MSNTLAETLTGLGLLKKEPITTFNPDKTGDITRLGRDPEMQAVAYDMANMILRAKTNVDSATNRYNPHNVELHPPLHAMVDTGQTDTMADQPPVAETASKEFLQDSAPAVPTYLSEQTAADNNVAELSQQAAALANPPTNVQEDFVRNEWDQKEAA